jgi:hypothetical protein
METHEVIRRRGSHSFLENRLTNGGEVVSVTHRPPFTPRKIPGTKLYSTLSRPQGHSTEWIEIEKQNNIIEING